MFISDKHSSLRRLNVSGDEKGFKHSLQLFISTGINAIKLLKLFSSSQMTKSLGCVSPYQIVK
jgi:hypothetical protein